MKYTNDMIDTYIQGDIDIALGILRDLANGKYTVDSLKTDVEESCITQGELDDIRNYEKFHRG
tara:strand:+ start:5021 stop:5209 length:189 start_codon:yes stop_codon:yes gene_type:complete